MHTACAPSRGAALAWDPVIGQGQDRLGHGSPLGFPLSRGHVGACIARDTRDPHRQPAQIGDDCHQFKSVASQIFGEWALSPPGRLGYFWRTASALLKPKADWQGAGCVSGGGKCRRPQGGRDRTGKGTVVGEMPGDKSRLLGVPDMCTVSRHNLQECAYSLRAELVEP